MVVDQETKNAGKLAKKRMETVMKEAFVKSVTLTLELRVLVVC